MRRAKRRPSPSDERAAATGGRRSSRGCEVEGAACVHLTCTIESYASLRRSDRQTQSPATQRCSLLRVQAEARRDGLGDRDREMRGLLHVGVLSYSYIFLRRCVSERESRDMS